MKSVDEGSRRRILQRAVAMGAVALAAPWRSVLASLSPTPAQTSGPFYPEPVPLETDGDLTMLKGATQRASGELIQVTGRLLDRDGKAIPGATIEIWQANAHGRYAHPRDVNPAPLDPNFQGYARITTDAEGRYSFKTIKPGAYPINPMNPDAVRTPHIHFDVAAKGRHLVTQMYFPGEALNEGDQIFGALGRQKNAAIAHVLPSTADIAAGGTLFGWDIVLGKA